MWVSNLNLMGGRKPSDRMKVNVLCTRKTSSKIASSHFDPINAFAVDVASISLDD